eukprot:TRINITY_DN55608_c0_g1_i2.p1 TRINITY_DN55608_c0_g1~~TRINITY_DN55608_c0_g1_i2.p1  ORF type:complete len:273 (-),score=105.82 TRINITY_DN55608_c0_g1_i2:969-1739(-)
MDVGEIESWASQSCQMDMMGELVPAPRRLTSLFGGKYAVNEDWNKKIALWMGDITRVNADAIVNAANSRLARGGGICGAIHKAAGYRLEDACDAIGKCDVGQTVVTPGFDLPCQFVLHTVGPQGERPDLLASCYRTCLDLCVAKGVKSVCFCCISTGIYGYPNVTAALCALETVREWLDEDVERASKIDRIVFNTFEDKDEIIYRKCTQLFFPIVRDLGSDSISDDDDDDDDGVGGDEQEDHRKENQASEQAQDES